MPTPPNPLQPSAVSAVGRGGAACDPPQGWVATIRRGTAAVSEHVDVVVVGAGISGIGAAVHLQEQCPGRTYVVLEAMDSFGGTWWTHRYPGVRSDSDLYTF